MLYMNKENLQYADSESDGVFAQRKELEGNKSSDPQLPLWGKTIVQETKFYFNCPMTRTCSSWDTSETLSREQASLHLTQRKEYLQISERLALTILPRNKWRNLKKQHSRSSISEDISFFSIYPVLLRNSFILHKLFYLYCVTVTYKAEKMC